MRIDIWSDVICPYCWIGKRHLETALATFREDHPDVLRAISQIQARARNAREE